jgi:hypothetical protein
LPNSFVGTSLLDLLSETGRRELILAGFMTHNCVSSTARAALDLGYRTTIDPIACATRDLPDGLGGVVAAQPVHDVSLAALSDRIAIIARARSPDRSGTLPSSGGPPWRPGGQKRALPLRLHCYASHGNDGRRSKLAAASISLRAVRIMPLTELSWNLRDATLVGHLS